MRQIVFIFLTFAALFSCGRKSKSDWFDIQTKIFDSPVCILGHDSALAEANKGHYYYTVSGTVYADSFEIFYGEFIKEKYDVVMRSNCVKQPFTTSDCFEETAKDIVLKKYGDDFYERTRKEAEELFKENEN